MPSDGHLELSDPFLRDAADRFRQAHRAIQEWQAIEDDAKAVLRDWATEHNATTLTIDGAKAVLVTPTTVGARWDKDRLRRDLGEAWHAYRIEGRPGFRVSLA